MCSMTDIALGDELRGPNAAFVICQTMSRANKVVVVQRRSNPAPRRILRDAEDGSP